MDVMKKLSITHTTWSSRLDADLVDNFTQSDGTFLYLLYFFIRKFLIEDRIYAVLANDHRQTQKHFLVYTVIALHNTTLKGNYQENMTI